MGNVRDIDDVRIRRQLDELIRSLVPANADGLTREERGENILRNFVCSWRAFIAARHARDGDSKCAAFLCLEGACEAAELYLNEHPDPEAA